MNKKTFTFEGYSFAQNSQLWRENEAKKMNLNWLFSSLLIFLLSLFCQSGLAQTLTCYADVVIQASTITCPNNDPAVVDPNNALGAPNFTEFVSPLPAGEFYSLGEINSFLTLGFIDNALINDSSTDADLFIYEVGPSVEQTDIFLLPSNPLTNSILVANGMTPDVEGFYYFGNVAGATSSIDIDQVVPGIPAGLLIFDQIKLVNPIEAGCVGVPGPDIDAVCALNNLDCTDTDGDNFTNCAGDCDDNDDSVFPGANITLGDVILNNQQEVNDFVLQYGCVNSIAVNDLIINEQFNGLSDINNLSGLSIINSVSGKILINNNPLLSSLDGLNNIPSTGGDFRISFASVLQNLDALSNLNSVGGTLSIQTVPSLQNIDGLANLMNIGESLLIGISQQLTNLDALSSITNLPEDLAIFDNSSLLNIDGLMNLTGIGDYLGISDNPLITNIDALSGVMTAVSLEIDDNNNLLNLDGLSGLTNVKGSLVITRNNNLTNINGLSNATFSEVSPFPGTFLIKNNPELCECSIDIVCDELPNFGSGNRDISNNEPNGACNSEADVQAACNAGGSDADGDGFTVCDDDCDDNNPNINPEATEICDGIDNDCDGQTDNINLALNKPATASADAMGNIPAHAFDGDPNTSWNAGEIPVEHIIVDLGHDYPIGLMKLELNQFPVESYTEINIYFSADKDDFGTPVDEINGTTFHRQTLVRTFDGTQTARYIKVQTEVSQSWPAWFEIEVYAPGYSIFYPDNDGDGFGNPDDCTVACSAPGGYVTDNTDCDDMDSGINPSAVEVCGDGIDNNCDGNIDEGFDADNDGVADCLDNCPNDSNPNQLDSDCDGVGDACDVCDGGDDTIDNNNDGLPDCAYPPSFNDIIDDWKCGNKNKKVFICHNHNNPHTICVSKNAIPAHMSHEGDYLGPCGSANCNTQSMMVGNNQISFAASMDQLSVNLNWATNFNDEVEVYEIERSNDGKHFEPYSSTANEKGHQEVAAFESSDNEPLLGYNFYRLRLRFSDGTEGISEIDQVFFQPDLNEVFVTPNPTDNELFVNLRKYEGKNCNLQIINNLGQKISEQNINSLTVEPLSVNVRQLKEGFYFLNIHVEGFRAVTKRFVVAKY